MAAAAGTYGCASSSDDGQSNDEAATAASGTACRVTYEDADIVVFRAPNGATSYAPKALHVVDMRVTPATANLPATLQNTRFAQNHVDYVLGARPRPDSLAKLSELVGPNTQAAPLALVPATAGIATSLTTAAPTFSTPDNGASIVADIGDATTGGLLNAAMKKAFVTGAHVTANVTCGTGTMQVAMTSATPIAFDITQAKVLSPGVDLGAVDTFLQLSTQIKNGAFAADLAKINAPDLGAQFTAFAATVDQKITPIVQQYGVTMAEADVQAAVSATWQAYLQLAQNVLTATQATVDSSDMQTRQADGSYQLVPGLSPEAQALLATANSTHKNVDLVMAESATGWATQNLQ